MAGPEKMREAVASEHQRRATAASAMASRRAALGAQGGARGEEKPRGREKGRALLEEQR